MQIYLIMPASPSSSASASVQALALPHIIETVIRHIDPADLPACATVSTAWFESSAKRLYACVEVRADKVGDPVVPWVLQRVIGAPRSGEQEGNQPGKVDAARDFAVKQVRRIRIHQHEYYVCRRHHAQGASKTRADLLHVNDIELDVSLPGDTKCGFFNHIISERLIVRQLSLPYVAYSQPGHIDLIPHSPRTVIVIVTPEALTDDSGMRIAVSTFAPETRIVIFLPPNAFRTTGPAHGPESTQRWRRHIQLIRAFVRLYEREPASQYTVVYAETYGTVPLPVHMCPDQREPMTLAEGIRMTCKTVAERQGARWHLDLNAEYMTGQQFATSPLAALAEGVEGL